MPFAPIAPIGKAKGKPKAKAKAKAGPRHGVPVLASFSNCPMELFNEDAFVAAFPDGGRFACPAFEERCADCGAHVLTEERCTHPVDHYRLTPAYTICCDQGRITLPPFLDPPEPLISLLRDSSPRAAAFRKHIRAYNASLCFASLGCNVDESLARTGIYSFRVQGQMYHHLGPLLSDSAIHPRYAQVYFHDSEFGPELEQRLHWADAAFLNCMLCRKWPIYTIRITRCSRHA